MALGATWSGGRSWQGGGTDRPFQPRPAWDPMIRNNQRKRSEAFPWNRSVFSNLNLKELEESNASNMELETSAKSPSAHELSPECSWTSCHSPRIPHGHRRCRDPCRSSESRRAPAASYEPHPPFLWTGSTGDISWELWSQGKEKTAWRTVIQACSRQLSHKWSKEWEWTGSFGGQDGGRAVE